LRLLLDTHVAVWAVAAPERLPVSMRDLLTAPESLPFVSAASLWEIAIKHALNRGAPGDMPLSALAARAAFEDAGFYWLDVTIGHAAAVERLPRLHGDPFDRLLLAQAMEEPMRLVTHDQALAAYGESVIAF
jgi:PIN domain nuclease of toxin-antitoxin system